MKQSIEKIKELLREHIEETRNYTIRVEAVSNDGAYSDDGKTNAKESLKKLYRDTANMKRDRILDAIKEMKLKEITSIDLNDNRLSNALSIINSLGKNTPESILRDIERQFVGNQASLDAVKGAYEKHDISTISIDRKIYNVNTLYNELSQGVYDDFKKPETITSMNRAFFVLDNIIGSANAEEAPVENEITINTLPTMF